MAQIPQCMHCRPRPPRAEGGVPDSSRHWLDRWWGPGCAAACTTPQGIRLALSPERFTCAAGVGTGARLATTSSDPGASNVIGRADNGTKSQSTSSRGRWLTQRVGYKRCADERIAAYISLWPPAPCPRVLPDVSRDGQTRSLTQKQHDERSRKTRPVFKDVVRLP